VGSNPIVMGPGTSNRFDAMYPVGNSTVRFFNSCGADPGSILDINGNQHTYEGTDSTGACVITPGLREEVSNQFWANLAAAPLELVDIISDHAFRVRPSLSDGGYPFIRHDRVQIGDSIFEVERVNYGEDETELIVRQIIHNKDLDQEVYLLASPYYESEQFLLMNNLPQSPFILELPIATHLKLDYTCYWTVRLYSPTKALFFEQELTPPGTKQELVVLNQPIDAGNMLLWDLLRGELDFDGSNLWMHPATTTDHSCTIETTCNPVWPNHQVDYYLASVRCNQTASIQVQFYPNPIQERTFSGQEVLRFLGPSLLEKPVESIRVTIRSETGAPVAISGLQPSLPLGYMQFSVLLVANDDRLWQDYDILFEPPIMKPYWPHVNEGYLHSDIGVTDSGFVIGV